MKLVVVTQEVDPASPVLGATVAKLRALAARVDEVAVLADTAVEGALPANCRVRLFRSRLRAGRGARFELALARELARDRRTTSVLAHMCPIYAVLAAPIARPLGVPVLLWFTHWRDSRLLRAAERLSTTVLTVDRRSFPLESPKVHAIGHGIDLVGFACVERPPRSPLTLLALGRTSPAKGLVTVVRAVASTDGVRLRVQGPSLTEEERAHRVELDRLVSDLGVADRIEVAAPVPREEVPGLLAGTDALVNNMRAGATDKVVYEAAATCLPVLASNPALDTLLPPELRFERDDVAGLAARIAWLQDADRAALGRSLRDGVERAHSVESWADAVVAAAARR
jgi:glycosyltransferase involved in cell wall biosynthesis